MNNNPANKRDVGEEREMNKVSLATYSLDKRNNFDYSADQVIKKLQEENQKTLDAHKGMSDLYENENEKFNALADQTGMSYHELLNESRDSLINVMYGEEEVLTFLQMKIIYAYKHLEINIKMLLKAAYPDAQELLKKKIPEFTDKQFLHYSDVKNFYERVKDFPAKFLDALCAAIYDEQYEFDDDKLKQIARSLALRMDKHAANKFIAFFAGFYNN